jgi:solute carrier family 25 phosphate transporter 3
MPDVHDASYYAKCMVGGIFSCGLTHMAVCPLDIVKCRMQVDPANYKSLGQGFKLIRSQQGLGGFTVGWLPTLLGYSAQGFGKFGFYEIFKDVYKGIVGQENAAKYQTVGFLVSSACAEFIADVMLCPMEAVKVKMQTANPVGSFPTQLGPAIAAVKAESGNGFYKGIKPLWARQIPYTMVKFAAFENTVRWFYRNVFTAPQDSYSKATQLSVTFVSGYWAGIFCAIVSQPADTLVSKLNQDSSKSIGQYVSELGVKGLYRGLGARIIMVGTLTGLQWWIYDTFKVAVGLSASGGGGKK